MKLMLFFYFLSICSLQSDVPFDVKIKDKNLKICQQGQHCQGNAMLRLHINKQGIITDYDVLDFRLKKDEKQYNYTVPYETADNKITYPQVVRDCDKQIKDYIRTNITVKHMAKKKLQQEYLYLISIKLN